MSKRIRLFLLLPLIFHSVFASAKHDVWGQEEIRRRFEVRGEIFVFDRSGKSVKYKAGPWNVWKTKDYKEGWIENLWSSNGTDYGPFAVEHKWRVQEDGSIRVELALYDGVALAKEKGKANQYGKLIKKEDRVLENLEPVSLLSSSSANQRVVIRFTPGFSDGESPKQVSEIPLSGSDVILTDSDGKVWANHITHECKYCGFETPYGTIFLSLYPFPGGKELGVASGSELEVRLGENRVLTFRSKSAYLPESVPAKLYGVFAADRKAGKFPSAGVMGRSEEKDFVAAIQHWPN